MERESHQPQLDLTIRHRQNGKLSDRVATSTREGCRWASMLNDLLDLLFTTPPQHWLQVVPETIFNYLNYSVSNSRKSI